MKTNKIYRLKKWLICKLGGDDLCKQIAELQIQNSDLQKDNKALESGIALLQQRYEELGVEIIKHTSTEYSVDKPIVQAVVDYITIPYQRLAIPRIIKGEYYNEEERKEIDYREQKLKELGGKYER